MCSSKSSLLFIFSTLLAYNCQIVSSEHIVFLLSCSGNSHRNIQWPLAEELASRGHEVTFISAFRILPKQNPNITEIIPKRLETFTKVTVDDSFDISNKYDGFMAKMFMVIDYLCYKSCGELLMDEDMQHWLSTTSKVDLILADSVMECASGLAVKLGAKYALSLPLPFMSKHFEGFGIPPETASIPDWDVSYKPPLSFFNRLTGMILPLVWRFAEVMLYPSFQSLFKEQLGIEVPSLYEMQANTSLIFINGDYITDYPRSYPPFVVKLPGLHIKDGRDDKPIGKELEDFIGNSNEGFIYMSFGTLAKPENLPVKIKEALLKSFEAFPNVKFIWKWNGEKPAEYPKNVLLVPWVNQPGLLSMSSTFSLIRFNLEHPKIKGFITQAGKPSTQEAIYNGVPMITYPVFADQEFHAHRFEDIGLSINLDIVTVNEVELKDAIKKILYDKRYKERAVQLSKLIKDTRTEPMDTAVWWIEFVLRHTQEEINLLKPLTKNITWYQRRELDIWAFLLICVVLATIVDFYLIKSLLKSVGILSKPTSNSKHLKNGKAKQS